MPIVWLAGLTLMADLRLVVNGGRSLAPGFVTLTRFIDSYYLNKTARLKNIFGKLSGLQPAVSANSTVAWNSPRLT
jgi:hypothetical protein